MKISSKNFIVQSEINLVDLDTTLDLGLSERKMVNKLKKARFKLSEFQEKMYAHNRYKVLICLQGMDTSGKDSLIREVFKDFNPRGVVVHSFKSPTSTELAHDYLWRHYLALPERGIFSVFNRSHYENVLVARVRPEIVLKEKIPKIESLADITENFWQLRFNQIRDFEKSITQNGTIVLKFFLHLGKNEQCTRILRRLNEEKHNWKFEPADINEREYWDLYQKYYQEAINKTSTSSCPWFIIPADDKNSARLAVAQIILEQLKTLSDVKTPELAPVIKEKLDFYRQSLKNEL